MRQATHQPTQVETHANETGKELTDCLLARCENRRRQRTVGEGKARRGKARQSQVRARRGKAKQGKVKPGKGSDGKAGGDNAMAMARRKQSK